MISMPALRQLLLGGAVALFSVIIILGALTLAFAERDQNRALAVLPTAIISTGLTLADLQQEWPTKTSSPSPTLTETPFLSPTAVICTRPQGMDRVSVLSGETLSVLALRYNVSIRQLLAWNCMQVADFTVGMYLLVPSHSPTPSFTPTATGTQAPIAKPKDDRCVPPSSWISYIVQPGDNLYQIGQRYRIPWQELQRANCLSTTIIRVGHQLYVPNVPPSTSPPPTQTAAPLPPTRAVPNDLPSLVVPSPTQLSSTRVQNFAVRPCAHPVMPATINSMFGLPVVA